MHARWTHAADQSARRLQRENAEQEAAAEALQRQVDFQKAQLALFRLTADWSPCLPACSCLASQKLPQMLWPLHQSSDHRHVEEHQCAYTPEEGKIKHPLQGISHVFKKNMLGVRRNALLQCQTHAQNRSYQ